MMIKRRRFGLAVAVTAAACLFGSSLSASAAGRSLTLKDCYQQTAFFPIPRAQAESYLPKGFRPAGAPAGVDEFINFYVASVVCGDIESPRLEMASTYVPVDPPNRYRHPQRRGEYFVLDAGAEGRLVSAVRRATCLGTFLRDASIDLTSQRVEPLVGPHVAATATSVDSDFLAANFVVNAEGSTTPMTDAARWFFKDRGSVRYFDAQYSLIGWGLGSSTVGFTSPYRDLPSAASGVGVLSRAEILLSAPRRCGVAR